MDNLLVWMGFNEAGAIEPRKRRANAGAAPPGCSFNEAGAIEPRKRSQPPPAGSGGMSFNEAGAIEPRKLLPDEGAS